MEQNIPKFFSLSLRPKDLAVFSDDAQGSRLKYCLPVCHRKCEIVTLTLQKLKGHCLGITEVGRQTGFFLIKGDRHLWFLQQCKKDQPGFLSSWAFHNVEDNSNSSFFSRPTGRQQLNTIFLKKVCEQQITNTNWCAKSFMRQFFSSNYFVRVTDYFSFSFMYPTVFSPRSWIKKS